MRALQEFTETVTLQKMRTTEMRGMREMLSCVSPSVASRGAVNATRMRDLRVEMQVLSYVEVANALVIWLLLTEDIPVKIPHDPSNMDVWVRRQTLCRLNARTREQAFLTVGIAVLRSCFLNVKRAVILR